MLVKRISGPEFLGVKKNGPKILRLIIGIENIVVRDFYKGKKSSFFG